MKTLLRATAGLLACSGSGVGLADASPNEPVAELAPLIITSPRTSSRWLTTPEAVSAVQADQAQGEQNLALDRLLAPVPGVFSQNRYNLAQGLRPSIRGFGARGSFGVRGVRVLVDGVPLTMPDGQTELDGLDLGLVERMEVLRGPASVLYGNAAGGVLAIETREPPATPYSFFDLSAGGLGYRRARVESGGMLGNLGGVLAYNSTVLDAYREHSRAETNTLSGKLRWYSDAGQLGLTFNAIDNRAEDPGGLTAAQVRAGRSQAAPNNLRYDADEQIRQQRLGLVWEGVGPGADTYHLRSYIGQREFATRLAFTDAGQTTYVRTFAGVGAQYSHRRALFGLAHTFTSGLDLEAQRDDRRRYDSLFGSRGEETLRQDEKARSSGLFIQDEIALSEAWQATLGLRYDRVRLAVDDHFVQATDGDDSGSRTLGDWNYSAGLSYRLDEHQSLYGRVATSFETPTVNELANPAGGGFNPSLQPSRAVNREIGLKGEWPGLRYDLALFSMKLEDELIGFSVEGRNYFRNAGASRREGLEASLDWQLAETWRLSSAYSYSRFRFEDYRVAGEDFAGNDIPGMPRHNLFSELGFERADYYARLNMQAVGSLYAEDANQVSVSGYSLWNARVGKRFTAGGQVWEPYLGLDNLFDRRYFDNVRINATAQRYFEPGPGRTLYLGMRATF